MLEFIETQSFYQSALAAISGALKAAASAVSGVEPTDYWAGMVLDLVRAAILPLVQEAMDETGLRRRLFVTTRLVDGDAVVNAGGSLNDHGSAVTLTIALPRAWFRGAPGGFYGIVRSEGERFAQMLARTLSHEILHLHQIARGEASLPKDGPDTAGIAARYKTRKAARGAAYYLTGKDEIAAQAESAALELMAYYARIKKDPLDLFRKDSGQLKNIVDAEWVSPHLTAYWRRVRLHADRSDAWKAFLKALYARLQHHTDPER